MDDGDLRSRKSPNSAACNHTARPHRPQTPRRSAGSSGGRRGDRRGGRPGIGRCPSRVGPCPICDRDQYGHDLRPSILHKTAVHRGEVRPIEPPHTAVVSNIRHATYSDFRLDTNTRLYTRNRDQGSEA
jgi:hypothetical protein